MPDKKPMNMRTAIEEETGLVDPYAEAMRKSLEPKPEKVVDPIQTVEYPLEQPVTEDAAAELFSAEESIW